MSLLVLLLFCSVAMAWRHGACSLLSDRCCINVKKGGPCFKEKGKYFRGMQRKVDAKKAVVFLRVASEQAFSSRVMDVMNEYFLRRSSSQKCVCNAPQLKSMLGTSVHALSTSGLKHVYFIELRTLLPSSPRCWCSSNKEHILLFTDGGRNQVLCDSGHTISPWKSQD